MTRRIPLLRPQGLAAAVLAAAGIASLPMSAASATTYTTAFDCAATSSSVVSGGADTVNGTLSFGVTPLSSDVDLEYSSDSGATWAIYAHGTTDSSGHVSWTVHPSATGIWECHYAGASVSTIHGTDTYTPATSPTFPITVTPAPGVAATHMTKAATPSTITAGQATSITVTLLSATAPVVGRTVYLEYYRPAIGIWQRLCTQTTDASGSASCPDSPPSTTTYAWGFDGDSTYGSSVSGNFDVTVNPASPPPPSLTPTHLSVSAPAGPVSPGTATTVTGYLQTTSGTPVAGRTVGLLANGVHVGDAVSDTTGFVQFVVYPTATTQYEWQFGGDATYGASQSVPPATVSVTTSTPNPIGSLISHISRHNIQRLHRLRIWGTYTEPFDGGRVVLYRLTANGRVRVAGTSMDSDGYYAFRLHPRTRGTKNYVAEVVDQGQAVDGRVLTVTVH